MNELREKIDEALRDMNIKMTTSMSVTGKVPPRLYEWEAECGDAILDAVIAALPFASADDEDGYVVAISEVKSLLEAAKESK